MSFWSKIFKSIDEQGNSKIEKSKETQQKLSIEEKAEIKSTITKLKEQITVGEAKNLDAKQTANVLTELGENYQKLNEVDKAIDAYEKSLKNDEDFGPAFDGLLKLYDVKRQAAAYAKDNDEIQKWLNKSDELTALSKKIMRSK